MILLLSLQLLAVTIALLSSAATGNYKGERRYLYALFGYTAAILAWFGTVRWFDLTLPWVYYWTYYGLVTIPVTVTSIRLVREESRVMPTPACRLIVAVACLASAVGAGSVMVFNPDVLVVFLAAVTFASGIIMHGVAQVREATDTLHGGATARTLSVFWTILGGSLFLYAAGVQVNETMWESVGQWLPGIIVFFGMLALAWSFHTSAGVPVHKASQESAQQG